MKTGVAIALMTSLFVLGNRVALAQKSGCDCSSGQRNTACLSDDQMRDHLVHVEIGQDRMGNHTNIRGVAVFEIVFGKDGRVFNAKMLSGHPIAVSLLIGTAQNWRFKPYTVSGVPTQACGRLSLNYSVVGGVSSVEVDRGTKAGIAEKEKMLGNGTVCVLPNSAERPTRISPGGDYNPATLMVRIDETKPLMWPHKDDVRIENLDLNSRHLVVLTSDGKRIQSFRFRFSDYSEAKLCLSFDGYQGVQLVDKQRAEWCNCQ